MEELLARLRIWSRRTVSLEDPGELCFGDLSYRPSVRQLSGPAGKEVLPKRLAQLIELLLRNAEVPITRNVIFNRIWGPDAEVTDAVIDTYIHLTRQRLAHLQSAVKIQNSRGTGYQLSYEREL
jgi:DNA-binding response OmpR family regulator